MKPRNPTLYRNLRQFTEDAINLMRNAISTLESVPTTIAYELEIKGTKPVSMKPVEKPLWQIIVDNNMSKISLLRSYVNCTHVVKSNAVIARHLDQLVGIEGGPTTIVRTDRILPNFLGSLLSASESLTFEQDRFDALYKSMENFFYSRKLHVQVTAPLINATGPDERILLADNVYIVPNPVTKLEQWLAMSHRGFLNMPWLDIAKLSHSLECQVTAPKLIKASSSSIGRGQPVVPEKPHLSVAIARVRQMVRALRLLKPGHIAVPLVEHQILEWHPHPSIGWQAPLYAPQVRPFAPSYVMQQTEVKPIACLYKALSHDLARKHRAINVALHRIDRSVEETEPAQRLVDLVIALEALLLPDTQEELSFRFSLRGAYFLASDAGQRHRFYEEFKKAYRLRSGIVHGGELPQEVTIFRKRVPIKEFVNRIENHTREVAKQMLLLATQPNATRELVQWDDLVLGPSEFK